MNFRSWLREEAFPLWLRAGLDQEQGGFHEKLLVDESPIAEPKRARLTARQIYCFLVAHEMGLEGGKDAALHGLRFLGERLLRDDGQVLSAVNCSTGEIDDKFDPYDYAFVLFALANGERILPEAADWESLAFSVLANLQQHRHPEIGFQEPESLRANPHMHLLESFLAWELVSENSAWSNLADEMVRLCMGKLLSEESGAVSEFFDFDWKPLSSQFVVEPGHQFEWAWLLMRWANTRNAEGAFRKAVNLVKFAEQHGIRKYSGVRVAVNSLDEHAAIVDAAAKLWPQTERLKAQFYLGDHRWASDLERESARKDLLEARSALGEYLTAVKVPGLWSESLSSAGWEVGSVKASSLYHIVCAIDQIEPLAA